MISGRKTLPSISLPSLVAVGVGVPSPGVPSLGVGVAVAAPPKGVEVGVGVGGIGVGVGVLSDVYATLKVQVSTLPMAKLTLSVFAGSEVVAFPVPTHSILVRLHSVGMLIVKS